MAAAGAGWPLRAACLYAALIPIQPVLSLPDGSQLRLAAAELVAPALLVAAAVYPRRRLAPGLALLAGGVALTALFSTLLAATERPLTQYAIGKTLGLLYVTAIGFAIARALPPGAEPRVLRAFAESAFLTAALGLAGFAAWTAGWQTSLVEWERLCSTMPGDPNLYGSVLALALLLIATDPRRSAAGRLVRLTVLAAALVLTGSRSAMAAAAVGSVVCAILRTGDRWRATARAAYGFVLAGVLVAPLLLTAPAQRATSSFRDHTWRDFTIESRFDLYDRALEQFEQHPVLGLGIGGFHDTNDWNAGRGEHFAVHNTYLWAFVDMGVLGGLLLTGLVVGAIARAARVAAHGPAAETAAVVAGALAAMAVFNLFVDGYYQRHLWIFLACALAMPLARARAAAPAALWVRPLRWEHAR